jgi:predicted RNA-binding protein with PIN domain
MRRARPSRGVCGGLDTSPAGALIVRAGSARLGGRAGRDRLGRCGVTYADRMQVLIVDGANVVGSRPDGWWRDRAGAARRLQELLATAALPYDEVVLVLEGGARRGNPARQDGHLRTVHAPGSGDDSIVEAVMAHVEAGDGRGVTVVTADRALRDRVETVGARSVSPSWLLDQL